MAEETVPTWAEQTKRLVRLAKEANLPEADMRKAISAFLNIDVAIKVTQQAEHLLEQYRDGKLKVTDFLDALLAIVASDKTMFGAQVQALHTHLGVAPLVRATKPKKAKETVKKTAQIKEQATVTKS